MRWLQKARQQCTVLSRIYIKTWGHEDNDWTCAQPLHFLIFSIYNLLMSNDIYKKTKIRLGMQQSKSIQPATIQKDVGYAIPTPSAALRL